MTALGRASLVLGSAALAAACGGGDDNAPMPKSYDFVTPQLSSQRTYGRTIIDNSNNTITETFPDTVTTVNSDGSYVVFEEDPTHDSQIVNGTTYAITTESIDVNNSGQSTSYSFTAADGNVVVCTYEPHGAGPDYPLQVGQSWTLDFALTCGSQAPLSYTQVGSVVDVESVTVPAGTYTALKLQSTVSWTDGTSTTRTQTITNYRDIQTLYSVEEDVTVAYSGTALTHGYPITLKTVLQNAT